MIPVQTTQYTLDGIAEPYVYKGTLKDWGDPPVTWKPQPVAKDGTATKFDNGKVMMGLLPPLAKQRIAEVFTFGANKYSSWNWSKGMQFSRLYDALQRHLTAWEMGEDIDPESGKSHLAHAGCCIMMLLETAELRKDLDDRPDHYKATTGNNN